MGSASDSANLTLCLSRFVDVRFCFLTMLAWVPFEVIGTHALVLFGDTQEMKQAPPSSFVSCRC